MNNQIISRNHFFRCVMSLYNSKAEKLTTAAQRREVMIACVDEVQKKTNPNHKKSNNLSPIYVAAMMIQSEHILNISFTDSPDKENSVLGIFEESGEEKGIYDTNEKNIIKAIDRYLPNRSIQHRKMVFSYLVDLSDVKTVNQNPDLIPVENGIFDYRNKVLLPFTPDIVFTAKVHTRFNPLAQNPIIQQPDGTSWDIHSWLDELFDRNNEKVNVLLQCLGATLRPHQKWGKALLLLSRNKTSGKFSVLTLVRALCGDSSCVNISSDGFANRFVLAPLLDKPAVAIISDNNSTVEYCKNSGIIKSLCSNDCIRIDRPYRAIVTARPNVFMIQALNDYPQFNLEKSLVFWRFILLDFPHDFQSEGTLNPNIKNDYLCRKDVLEYLLKYLLVDFPDYYKIESLDFSHSKDD